MAFWESMPRSCWNPAIRIAYRTLGWAICAAVGGFLAYEALYEIVSDPVGIDRDKIVAQFSRPNGVPELSIYFGEDGTAPTKGGPAKGPMLAFLKSLTPEQEGRILKAGLSPDEIW